MTYRHCAMLLQASTLLWGYRSHAILLRVDSFSSVLLIVECCCYCCCCLLRLLLLVPAAVAAAAGSAIPSGKACVCRQSIVARAKELTAVFWKELHTNTYASIPNHICAVATDS